MECLLIIIGIISISVILCRETIEKTLIEANKPKPKQKVSLVILKLSQSTAYPRSGPDQRWIYCSAVWLVRKHIKSYDKQKHHFPLISGGFCRIGTKNKESHQLANIPHCQKQPEIKKETIALASNDRQLPSLIFDEFKGDYIRKCVVVLEGS